MKILAVPIDLLNFVRKWNASQLTERSAAPQHFRDLCEALGVPHPTEEDEIGSSYTFERHVKKAGTGEPGYADVWKRGWFAWEYKSKGGDLKAAYKQLNEYHEALDNPPLLVVCDFTHFEVHTKFENVPSRTYAFTLDDLLNDTDTATSGLPPVEVLRYVFGDFNQLRPGIAAIRVTKAAASDFLRLAQQLELEKAASPSTFTKAQIAHFLMRLVFCLFADSIDLLPSHAFRNLVKNNRHSPIAFNRILPTLFAAMSEEDAFFGPDMIPYFNGGLFSDNFTIPLNHADLGILQSASQHDWSHIEPVIFGTLFERSLDAAKRSMIGAHYTSPEDILLLIEPVVVAPLKRRWETVKQSVLDAIAAESPATAPPESTLSSFRAAGGSASQSANNPGAPHLDSEMWDATASPTAKSKTSKLTAAKRAAQPALKLDRPALDLLQAWAAELTQVRILDPACGSGNFLYIALRRLLDLWHEARVFGIQHGLTIAVDPIPHPGQLFGIEIDFYAHEIASIVVWIGFLQWKRDHNVIDNRSPVLQKLSNIEHDDAIMRYDAEGKPYEPEWPVTDFIVGNPPFLGGSKMKREIKISKNENWVADLRELYKDRVPGGADLVTYWFEKARYLIQEKRSQRAGLIATQSIRAGSNRKVLQRIKSSGDIFMAWSDREWVLDGADVRVSLIAFDDGSEFSKSLDGLPVARIHENLSVGDTATKASSLKENLALGFKGLEKNGDFEITPLAAKYLFEAPVNVNGRPNTDVVFPWINHRDVTTRSRGMFIIDFGLTLSVEEAALYELPFEWVKRIVLPNRLKNGDEQRKKRWWRFGRSGRELRKALERLPRFIATGRVSKHRTFVWINGGTVPDSRLFIVARDDDYFFGVLHSIIHEIWSLATSSRHGIGNDPTYNGHSCFDTFPFPYPPNNEPKHIPAELAKMEAIAAAARNLVQLRDAWLNPPDTPESDLKKRTLTNLYNQRPTWLSDAHHALDQAVFAAYGWPLEVDGKPLTTSEILSRLLALNHERAAAPTNIAPKPPRKAPATKRANTPAAKRTKPSADAKEPGPG